MFSPSASPPSLSSSHGFVLVAFVVVSSEDVFEAAVEGVLVEEAQAEYRDCGLDCNKKPSRLVVTDDQSKSESEQCLGGWTFRMLTYLKARFS